MQVSAVRLRFPTKYVKKGAVLQRAHVLEPGMTRRHSGAMTRFPAIILAGGRSSRMGGGDKGLLALNGKPIIGHVIDRLARQCQPLLLSANGDPQHWANN